MGTNTPSPISVLNSSSDDDVFTGKITLKEVRKVLFMSRRTMSAITLSDDEEDEEEDTSRKIESESSSVELIDDVSEPDLMSLSSLHITPSKEQTQIQGPRLRRSISHPDLGYSSPRPDYRESFVPKMHPRLVSDDSFYEMEAAAANTSDRSDADFITQSEYSKSTPSFKVINATNTNSVQYSPVIQIEKERVSETTVKKQLHDSSIPKTQMSNRSGYKKPLLDKMAMDDAFKAFQNKIKLSKTPNGPKSATSYKTTPFKSQSLKKFGHILSPVGFFIKNSAHTPLMKTVRPGKPVTELSASAIPKYVGMAKSKQTKENLCPNLPPKAYVSAKTTKTIVIPSTKQLPKNNQVQKMASSLTQPTVIRHERREKCGNSSSLKPGPDESWAGLPASQADLSVRIVKVAAVADTLKKK